MTGSSLAKKTLTQQKIGLDKCLQEHKIINKFVAVDKLGDFMFLDNKYTKWYFSICSNHYEGITEKHHIIPKSLGGSDEEQNLVSLSPKAHFICHWLLTRMLSDKKSKEKMYYAFNFMLLKPKDLKEKRYYPCSRVYDIARKYMQLNNPNNHVGVKKKISEARKKCWQNPSQAMLDGIEKMRLSKIGKEPPNKGKKGIIKASDETKKLLSQQRYGRKWFNDGVKTYFIKPEDAKSHYKEGRI